MRSVRLKIDDRNLQHFRQELCRLASLAGQSSNPLWVMAGYVLSQVDNRLYARCKQLPEGKLVTLSLHPYEAIAIWQAHYHFPEEHSDHLFTSWAGELHRQTS